MAKHMMFLRWWLLVILMTLGGFVAFKAGAFHDMWFKDATYLSFFNLAILLLFTVKCGVLTWRTSSGSGNLIDLETKEETGWFWSAQVLSIGMFGTVCGFLMMLEGAFGNIDFSDPLLAQTALPKMVMGISTALYTTLTGLLASVLLKIQYYNVKLGLKRLREKHGK
jgi:hypothetical protein